VRWIVEELDNWLGHLLLLVRGCQHPKFERHGAQSVCTVCGLTLTHE
jgi:hypothetical protein